MEDYNKHMAITNSHLQLTIQNCYRYYFHIQEWISQAIYKKEHIYTLSNAIKYVKNS